MSNTQSVIVVARAVTVAGVAGGALAVGVAVYQPRVAPDLTGELALTAGADRVIPFERALRTIASNAAHLSAMPSLPAGPCSSCHSEEPMAAGPGDEASAASSPSD